MLKKQRNALYLEIVSAGIDPQYFEIVQEDSREDRVIELIKVRDNGMFFEFIKL